MRKKILIIFLTGVLIFSGILVNADDGNIKIKEKSIEITGPIVNYDNKYVEVDINEASSVLQYPGEPMLPIINQVFTLPFGSKISSVEVSFSEAEKIPILKEVKPAPEPVPLSSLKISEETVKNPDIYNSAELYPNTKYVYTSGAGLDGDKHVTYVSVRCYPIRYSPKENMIYYSDKVEIKITYEESSISILSADDYDLVIISPSKFTRNLQTLVDHKNNHGVRTILKTTEEIYDEFQGRDEPEKIKYFIKEAIESWNAKYALLVGDIDSMPIRMTVVDMWDLEELPTDLYYADIYDENGTFCSWDSDGDNNFGEYDRREGMIDKMDLYADIKVGRIPCSNNLDLKTVIGKIITYETESYAQDWFDRAVLMGGDTFPDEDEQYEGVIVLDQVSQQIPEFEHVKLYTTTNNYGPVKINREITKGAGFVSYSGHGYYAGFGTSAPHEEDRIEYYMPYTIGMLNNNKFPVFFFDACLTATLDFEVGGINFPCIAWYLIKKPVGGAIATIGATRVAFTHVNEDGAHGGAGFMNVHFFKAYEPGVAVSQMLVSAQNDYINNGWYVDCFTLEEFILLGDPSLKAGGYPPSQNFNVKIDSSNLNGCPNAPIELKATGINGKQPYSYSWDLDEDGIYDDATGEIVERIWTETGIYWASVKVTDSDNNEKRYHAIVNIESKSIKPSGPTGGKAGSTNTFTVQANSNSCNEIYHIFDWGDGSYSEVLGPYALNEVVSASHKYDNEGNYKIRVKTLFTDSIEEISEETGWSDPHEISISKSRSMQYPLLTKILTILEDLFPRLKYFF
jgi:hypothetical protein